MGDRPLSRRERDALCDLALELGEDVPTLCTGWDAKDLVVHLLVRERSLLAAPGVVVPQLRWLTERETARLARRPYADLVAALRSTRWTLVAIPAVDRLLNTLEFFVHHEDLRRAQEGWTPRALSRHDESVLWSGLRAMGPAIALRSGVRAPVALRRTDKGSEFALVSGDDPVVVSGPPSELLLLVFGRETAGLEYAGPEPAVADLRAARFSL